MPFIKFANSTFTHPGIHQDQWERVLATQLPGQHPGMRRARTEKIIEESYDPNEFLLSHATIIASVDTEDSPEPTGRHKVDGFQINRPYSDWLITPETNKYVNHNNDAWERKLLLAAFPTFVGGDNFVEHIQIPELSKGKILDAAARDIGDSIYVDILIATHRKHRDLVAAITSGQLQTMSMGCSVAYTLCSKCGNQAADETQLCNHIKYFKGRPWTDKQGKQRVVAELCGHLLDEPGSVQFVEASWVGNPAFKGAVLRSFIVPQNAKERAAIADKLSMVFEAPPRIYVPGAWQRAARVADAAVTAEQFDPGGQMVPGDGGQGTGQGQDAPGAKDPIDSIADDLAAMIRERAINKVREDISRAETRDVLEPNGNNNLVKEALKHPAWRQLAAHVIRMVGADKHKDRAVSARRILLGMILYKQGGWEAVRTASLSGREILAVNRFLESTERVQRAGRTSIYATVVAVNGLPPDQHHTTYLAACSRHLGRTLNPAEADELVAKGRLFALGQ